MDGAARVSARNTFRRERIWRIHTLLPSTNFGWVRFSVEIGSTGTDITRNPYERTKSRDYSNDNVKPLLIFSTGTLVTISSMFLDAELFPCIFAPFSPTCSRVQTTGHNFLRLRRFLLISISTVLDCPPPRVSKLLSSSTRFLFEFTLFRVYIDSLFQQSSIDGSLYIVLVT